MNQSNNNWRLGLPLSLGAALMWAILPIMLKGLLSDMEPATTALYRYFLAAVLLYALLNFRNKTNTLRQLGKHRVLLATLIAGLMLAANYLFFALSVDLITPSASQILIQLAPISLLIGSIVIFREPFSPLQWLGCLIFIGGLVLFFHHRLNELVNAPDDYALGVLYMVIAALTWGAYALIQKRILPYIEAQQLNLVMFAIGSICLLPLSSPLIPDISGGQWLLLVLCAANTLIAYGCFTAALHHWQATKVSATITIVPILTLLFVPITLWIWPGLFERETLDWLNYSGAILVVLGSLTVVISKPKGTEKATPPA